MLTCCDLGVLASDSGLVPRESIACDDTLRAGVGLHDDGARYSSERAGPAVDGCAEPLRSLGYDRGRFFIAAPSLLLWICHRV